MVQMLLDAREKIHVSSDGGGEGTGWEEEELSAMEKEELRKFIARREHAQEFSNEVTFLLKVFGKYYNKKHPGLLSIHSFAGHIYV